MELLEAGEYRLEIDPGRGGAIVRFDWRGEALMRRACGSSIFDVACFPLVPFSNRIANGRFRWGGRHVHLAPNFPGGGHPHPLHGQGWLAAWTVRKRCAASLDISYDHRGDEWPWSYRAEQRFDLTELGLRISLSVRNLSDEAMPAGLGLHPYFPVDSDTMYYALHRGEWQNDETCLPVDLDERLAPRDWWDSQPAISRPVDTVYTDRSGPLWVVWPSRSRGLLVEPSALLAHSVVYTPTGEDFFCVEPVSHMTDAVNRNWLDMGLVNLPPNSELSANVRFRAYPVPSLNRRGTGKA